MYLTASVGAGSLTLEFDGDTEDSDTGIAFDVGLGKEWWVSDRWGLGVSRDRRLPLDPARGRGRQFSGPSFAVRFSATFN